MHGFKLTIFGMVILLGTLILSAPANAGLHHDHHSADSHFDKAPQGKPHHCALKGHSSNKPCPHLLNSKGQEQKLAIGPDCGGLPFPSKSIPFSPLNEIFLNHQAPVQNTLREEAQYCFPAELYKSSLFSSIDHPPKFQ